MLWSVVNETVLSTYLAVRVREALVQKNGTFANWSLRHFSVGLEAMVENEVEVGNLKYHRDGRIDQEELPARKTPGDFYR